LGNIWKFPYSSPKLVTVTKIYLFVLKTITPVLLIIIFLNSIGIINFK
jgi:SNF family Na+-dependent transporter